MKGPCHALLCKGSLKIAKLNLNSTQLNSTQTEVEMVYIST